MSEPQDPVTGPQMVVATPVMKRGPVRISQIGSDITLPRPVRAVALAAVVVGGLLGSFIGLVLGGLSSIMYGALIFAAIGYGLVTFSPLQGESFLKWAELTWGTKRRANFTIDGQHARVSVGVCPVPRPSRDELVMLAPGAVRIPPSQYDHRGVRISERNRNLDEAVTTPTLTQVADMIFPSADAGMNPDPWSPPHTAWRPVTEADSDEVMLPKADIQRSAPADYHNPDPWA